MKIQIKPLKGEAFDIEAEPEDSVEAFKAKIESLKGDLPAETQKLVFSGKVLQDGATLQDSGITDGCFMVLMKSKAPSGSISSASAAAAASAAPAVAPPPAPAPVPAATSQATLDSGGQNAEATIQMMMEMGFPRSDVERCLRAAFGNPDRAVEYLMSGIPPGLMQQASGQAPPPQPAPAPAGQAGMPMGGMFPQMPPGNATGPLAKLQNHPLFFRLKAAVQQNPAALNQVLGVIHQGDPSMIMAIAEHQEEFVALMAEPLPAGMPGMRGQGAAAPSQPAPAAGGAVPPGGGAMDPVQQMIAMMQMQQQPSQQSLQPQLPQQSLQPQMPAAAPAADAAAAPAVDLEAEGPPQLSATEQEAIGRLEALGFDRAMVTQAYVACERNEELAANYLFDMADDN